MCLGALLWARPAVIYYANSRMDAAQIGFDDEMIYQQLALAPDKRIIPCQHVEVSTAIEAFKVWNDKKDKIAY